MTIMVLPYKDDIGNSIITSVKSTLKQILPTTEQIKIVYTSSKLGTKFK